MIKRPVPLPQIFPIIVRKYSDYDSERLINFGCFYGVMMQLSMSAKGEIVIPKKIREQLGLVPSRAVILDVKENVICLHPARQSIAKKWAEIAKRINLKSSQVIHGDALYEKGEYF